MKTPPLTAYLGKKIMVTGGAGFIGSELCAQLSGIGAEIIAVDNLVNGKRENINGINNVTLKAIDIRDREEITKIMKEIDIVFHLACLGVRHSIHSPMENHDVNASATLQLLKIANNANIKRFVHISTSEVYGTAKSVPMTEDHPTFPMTVYGASKLAGECYARAFWTTYNFPTVIVRPFNSFGPRCHHEGDSGEVIPKFLLRAMANKPMIIFGDGSQTRDFTYVSDTATGILLSGCAENIEGKTINIGSGQEVSINHLADIIASTANLSHATKEHIETRPGDVHRLYADTTIASNLLNFKPEIALQDGLQKLRTWYDQSPGKIEQFLSEEQIRNWEKIDTVP